MGFKPYTLLLGTLFTLISLVNLQAQDNIVVEYNGALGLPNFLNICGEPDTARMTVRVTGLEIEARENIVANLNLFQGAQFVEFLSAESDAGVTLLGSTISTASFAIPDLDPFVTTSIDLVFLLKSDCSFIDTIAQNNQALVFDTWNLAYDLDGSSLTETELTAEYKDAFAVPNLTISNTNNVVVSSIGECFDRDIILSNSGLSGFIDSIDYEATYGPGITVTNITVNGIDYPLIKTPVGVDDTFYQATIVGEAMELNTIGGIAGNGNQSLDPDESLFITETVCVISCDTDRSSIHNVSWGCYGAGCESETLSNFVSIGSGEPNAVAVNSGTVANEVTGYCQDGSQTITFTNSGNEVDPGYGTMRDLELGIGLGNDFFMDVDKFEIFSITIAGITINTTNPLVKLDDLVEFQTDPMNGLIDFDNDGYYDDLPINESIEITVGYRFDCSEANSTDENCENSSAESLHSRILYSNSCAERLELEDNSVIRPSNITPDSESSTETDALVGDVFHVQYEQLRTVSNFAKSCSGDERMIVTLDLPTGITVDLSETNLFKSTTALPLVSTSTTGTIMELIFDSSISSFISGEFTIDLGLVSDCSAAPGATSFPVTLAHFCPDCNCTHTWYCGDLDGPILHANTDLCANAPPCPNGVRALAFDVERTTLGYTDETYSQEVNPQDVNLDVAISCDSVSMTVTSVVGDDIITNDVGVIISYDNPEEIEGLDEIFLFDGGNVEIRQVDGTISNCTVAASAMSVTAVDLNKTLDIELDDCLASLGLTLSPLDTIVFQGMFSLNPEGPYNEQFKLVPNFRGEMYHTFAGDQLSCDNFGEVFTIAKTGSLFTFPSTPSFPRGCTETSLQYEVAVFNNDFGVFYPNEFIPAAFADSIRFSFDPSILDAFDNLSIEVSIPNHPVHGNGFYEIDGLSAFPDGNYLATFDTLNYIPSYNTAFSSAFTLRLNLVANCGSETASSDGNNLFNFTPTIYYRDRIYAESIGDGSCANYVEDTVNSSIQYTQAPTFSFHADTNPDQFVKGDVVEWRIQHCNTSVESDAGLNWLALEIPNNIVSILSIEDISTGAPVDVPFTAYGTNNSVFAYVDPLLRNFSGTALEDICNTYIITATFNECGAFPIVAKSGWNCTDYDEIDWTPELYAPCNEDTIDLSVTTLEGALDAEVQNQPTTEVNLCDTLTYEILVKNTDLGNIHDMNNEYFLPLIGLDFVPSSFELSYPSSNSFVPISDPISQGTTARGEAYQFEDFSNISTFLNENGLQGFNAVMPIDSNEYVIRFKVVPGCNFISGEQIPYSFQGVSACGDSTNVEFGETLPIFVQGVPQPTQFFLAEFGSASTYNPAGTGTLEVVVSNIVGGASDNNDVIRVVLPLGSTYTANSVMPIAPLTWIPGEPEIVPENGFNILYWDMPTGVLQAETINFTFDYTGAPIALCDTDTLSFNLFTLDRYDVECGVTSEVCSIFAGTTEGGEQTLDLIISNGITLDISNSTSNCINDTTEEITVNGIVNNLPTLTEDATISFFFDADMNGEVESGTDVLLSTFTIPTGSSGTINFSETYNVTNAQLCNLLVVLDATNVGTCTLPDPVTISPQLENAGPSANYCGNEITIGNNQCASITSYTYLWTAIAPATNAQISDINILNPTLTLDPSITEGTMLSYVLETTRNGCGFTSTDTINITVLADLTVSIDDGGSTVVCEGESTTLTANASEAVTHAWSDETSDLGTNSTLTISPTANTTYIVVVTNAGGCTTSSTIDMTIGTGVTTVDAGDDTTICLGNSIQLIGTSTGGTGIISYSWSGTDLAPTTNPNPIVTPTTTTTYSLTVTDGNGCAKTDEVIITVDPNISNVDVQANNICVGLSTVLTASGGNTYAWTEMAGNPSTGTLSALNTANPTFTPETTGTHNFEVLISGGCEDITVPVSVNATSIQVTSPQVDLDQCFGDIQLASITLEENIQSYTINGATFQNDASTGETLTFSAVYDETGTNSYVVELVGVSGCSVETTFNFVSCGCIPTTVSGTLVANSNCGESTGSATITITDNPNDYTFTWAPNTGTPSGNGESRSDLEAGFYTVTIEENGNQGCIIITNVIIGNTNGPEPTSIVTTPATCNNADGTAIILPADWTYNWSDNNAGSSRNDLSSGIYGVTIIDPSDPTCTNVISIVIQEDNDLITNHNVITAPTCGNNDGSVEITVSGGNNNYSFAWSDGGTGAIRNNLSSGTYLVNITEIGGDECTTSYIFALPDSDVPQATVTINETIDVQCAGEANGSVDFTVSIPAGITNPLDTIITDGFAEWTNGSLAAGQYCIEIRDANDCVNGTACFEIESPEQLVADISTTTDGCSDEGSVEINVTGGTGTYTFDWADIPGTNNPKDRVNLATGNYQLTISDSNGCQMTLDGGVTIDPCPCTVEPEIGNIIIQEAHCGMSDGEVTIFVSPTTASLVYTWSPDLGIAVGDGNIRTNVPAGTYTVTVADATGLCSDVVSFAVTNQDGPAVEMPIATTNSNCGASDGTATILPANLNYAWSDQGTGNTRTDLAASTYFVSVSNIGTPACFTIVPITIGLNNDLVVTVNTTIEATCGNADGAVLASSIGGSGTYDYAWSFGGSSSAAQSNLQSGIYAVTVTDVNGVECQDSTPFILEDSDVVGADIAINSIDDVSCGDTNDGMINYIITPEAGFQGPATVIISDGNSVFENGMLPIGNYCIAIYDVNGCVAGGDCFEVGGSEELDVEFSIAEGCGNLGAIDINISNSTGTYTFDWADLPGTNDPEDRDNLATGLYSVTITSTDGCTATGIDLVVDCSECDIELDLESVVMTETTCGNADGSAIINVNTTANLADLTFTWLPNNGTAGNTGNIRTNLPAGGYTVTVADDSGLCSDVISFVVNNSDAPELAGVPVTTAADCGVSNGTATLLPTTYTYNWSDGGTGSTRTDLEAGTYFVTFFDPANPDCEGFVEIIIDLNNTLEVTVTTDVQSTCGNADGTVTANVTGGSGNYLYAWSFGGINMTESGLASGTYAVTVTDLDSPACTASTTFTLTDSNVAIMYDVVINNSTTTNVSCTGAADGFVDFTVNPTTGFTAVISDGLFEYTNGNLPGGNYCINIIDDAGCSAESACFVIEENDALEGEFSISGGCQDDGMISLIITGGTGNYTYAWSDLTGTNQPSDRADLPEGMYNVTITDDNGCSIIGSSLLVECGEECDIELDLESVVITEASCGNTDGEAIINVNTTANLADLTFTWLPNNGTTGVTGNIRTDLPAGGYTVTVADDSGLCSDVISFVIDNSDAPELADVPVTTAADCGVSNGTATLLPTTYTYNWSDGGTGSTRTDLEAGTYFVTFFDPANPDCEGFVEIIIDLNNTLEVTVMTDVQSTCGNADGTVTANVTNGSGNYAYTWSFGGTNMTESGLASEIYAVTVTDLDSPACTASTTFSLTDSNVAIMYDVIINNATTTNVSCAGAADGFVDFTVNPTTGFTAVISDGSTEYTNGNLSGGNYCINIIDDAGCSAGSACFEIEENDLLEGEFSISGGCQDDGMITVIMTGGTGNYTYTWSDLPSTDTNQPSDRTDLQVGLYSVTVTDENGCSIEGSNLTVECSDCAFEPEVLSTTIFEATCGNSDGEVIININIDPSLPIYTWSPDLGTPGVTGNIRTDLPAGGYMVTISDPSGECFDVVSFAINNEDAPELTTDPVTTPADCGAENGTALLTPSTYTYSWSGGGAGDFRSDLAPGIYFVTYFDPANPDCEGIVEVAIGLNNNLEANITVVNAPTCGNADGEITVDVINGSGNYTYAWNSGGTGMTASNLTSGTYMVTVTDADAPECTITASIVLFDSDVTNVDVVISNVTDIDCAGLENGAVEFTVTPNAGLTVIITDNGNNVYESGSLPAGDYCIQVSDASNCIVGGECFTITEPEALDVEFSISGGCADDGAIDISINGGTGNYNIDWLDISDENNDEDRANLMTGVYSVVITDESDCSVVGFELPIICEACVGPTIDYTISFESNCGLEVGSAEVVLVENPAGYTFTWTPTGVGILSADGNKLTDLPAGVYQVVIADTANVVCADSVSILVTNEDAPVAIIEDITPSDCGAANGSATLSPDSLTFNWSDGMTGAIRNDLAAGIYEVIYYDDEDTTCYNALFVEIQDTVSFELSVDITQLPDCNTNNGSVTINVNGGTGPFTFFWSNGKYGQGLTDLYAGTYTVVVTDEATGCSSEITFTLNDNVAATATIDNLQINNISCNGESLGSVVFDVNYEADFTPPTMISITDGFTQYSPTSLSAGSYCINVMDANGCVVTSECFDIIETDELEVSIIGTFVGCEDSGELGALDVTVTGGTAPYVFDWADLNEPTEPEDRTDLETGIYNLTITDALGCTNVSNDIGLDSLCILDCDYFEGLDTLVISTIACEDSLQVCTGLSYSDFLLGDYDVFVDGMPYDITVEDVCQSEGQLVYNYFLLPGNGNIGPYFLESWIVNGVTFSGEFLDAEGLVDSMNIWDPMGNWTLVQEGTATFITTDNISSTYGTLDVYVVAAPGEMIDLTLGSTSGATSVGVTVVGPGEHDVVIINNETLCPDTLIVDILCLDYELTDTITLGDSIFYCLDVVELLMNTNLEGNIVSMENVCPDASGESVIFNIETEVPPCISYLGITPGTDTACLVLCDDLGVCDTVNYVVTVISTGPITVTDTIIVTQIDTFCLDTLTNLCGEIQEVNNFCDDGSTEVIFEIIEDTWCVTYEGVELGIDSACLEVIDEYGNADTVFIVITVAEITTDTICDTIVIGQVVQYCLDTTELLAPVETINYCSEGTGEFVEFFLEEGTWCVTYEGIEDIGADSACIVICDELGICDTTFFCITVVEYFDPPMAVDDYDTTEVNVPIVINVKGNDTVLGGIDSIYIIDGPQVGSVEINMDCTITYDPDDGVCSVEDYFTYVVCNPNACDTATVFIYIECVDLTIFNGFSPNDDGVNDVFYIDGIEDYPNNRLCIYNRWGNKVYEKDGYNNEWSGTWSGNDLPDGTYFYVLDLGDEDRTKYHGYVQIHR